MVLALLLSTPFGILSHSLTLAYQVLHGENVFKSCSVARE
jgi:hypothetical protein